MILRCLVKLIVIATLLKVRRDIRMGQDGSKMNVLFSIFLDM
jgi:hypothetical protein